LTEISFSYDSLEKLTLTWKDYVRSIGLDKPLVSDSERMILTCGGKFLSEDDLFLNKDPLQDTLRYSKTLDLALSRRGFFGDDDDTHRTPKKWKHASTYDPKLGDAKLQWDLPDTERDRLFDSINDSIRNFIQSVYNEPKERTQLPQQLRDGLDSLLRRITKGEIIVTSCDKNLGFVVLSSKTYVEAVMVHLQDTTTYRLVGADSKTIRDGFKSKYTRNLRKLLEDHKGFIDWKTIRQLVEATEEASKNTQYFKIIIKIHKMKPDLEKIVGRPITPARGFYTSILSRYVSDFLVQALPLVNSYVRDASDAIQKLYNLRLQRGVTYFSGTGDIPSMFTNIPMNLESIGNCVDYVLRLIKQAGLHENWPSRDFLVNSIRLVCDYNIVTGPDGNIYMQIEGLAMGTSLSAAFASLSIAWREELFLNMNKNVFQAWLRFADDIYFLSSTSMKKLRELVLPHYCGSVEKLSNIDWTIVDAHQPATFLDVSVSLGDSNGEPHLISSLYQKELNQYCYLPFHSGHMPHMLRNWIASETRRIATLCFRKQDFNSKVELFKERLIRRGYPLEIIEQEVSKVDHTLVQHKLLHLEARHAGCALCEAAIQPIITCSLFQARRRNPNRRLRVTGITREVIGPNHDVSEHSVSVSTSKGPNKDFSSRDNTRYIVLPTLPGLTHDTIATTQMVREGFNTVEDIAGLKRSKLSIGWTNTPNLSKVLNKAMSKGLRQRR